jgi:hypothetical protein
MFRLYRLDADGQLGSLCRIDITNGDMSVFERLIPTRLTASHYDLEHFYQFPISDTKISTFRESGIGVPWLSIVLTRHQLKVHGFIAVAGAEPQMGPYAFQGSWDGRTWASMKIVPVQLPNGLEYFQVVAIAHAGGVGPVVPFCHFKLSLQGDMPKTLHLNYFDLFGELDWRE